MYWLDLTTEQQHIINNSHLKTCWKALIDLLLLSDLFPPVFNIFIFKLVLIPSLMQH